MNHANQKLADRLARELTYCSGRADDLCCYALEDGGIVIRTWCCDAAKGADYVKLLDAADVREFLASERFYDALDCGSTLEGIYIDLLEDCRWEPIAIENKTSKTRRTK